MSPSDAEEAPEQPPQDATDEGPSESTSPIIDPTATATVPPPPTTAPPGFPRVPELVSPAHQARRVATDAVLRWSGGHPDGTSVMYQILLNGSPLAVCNGAGLTCSPTLALDTEYRWKVVATDANGRITQGAEWTFATNRRPGAPSDPVPAIGAEAVATATTLRWSVADPDGVAAHAVTVLGRAEGKEWATWCQGTGLSQCAPATLEPLASFEWKVAVTDGTFSVASPDWSFTAGNSLPPAVALAAPAPGAADQPITGVQLSWTASTDPDAGPSPLKYRGYYQRDGGQPIGCSAVWTTAVTCNTAPLAPNEDYTWWVLVSDQDGDEPVESVHWAFRTSAL